MKDFLANLMLRSLRAHRWLSLDTASSWRKEGDYHLVVHDSAGKSVQSATARVTVVEPAVGCTAGSYFTYTSTGFDQGYGYIAEYFDGPRGKFLLHSSYDTYKVLYSNASYSGLKAFNVPALPYKGATWMNCRTTIPRIHTPTANPNYEIYSQRFNDSYSHVYQGQINFECRNNKLLLTSNTCRWVKR